MAPSVPPVVTQVLSAVQLAPVPGLSPAIEVLKSCIDLYNGVKANRDDCDALLGRSADLLQQVNEILKDSSKSRSPMDEIVTQVQKALESVRDTLSLASKRSFVYWLFHQEQWANAIAEATTSVDDAFRIAGVKGDIVIYRQLQDNHREVIDELAALKPTSSSLHDKELRAALRRLLTDSSNGDDKSLPETPLYGALKEILGSEQDNDLPPYTTTSYEIVKEFELHRGPYSLVWKGKWQNCSVAIKEVPLSQEITRQDLERQLNVWSGLRHEHVLQFYAVSATSEIPFLVSPYMSNGDLMAYLRSNPEADRVHFLQGIAYGMQYLHSRNFVHGNLQGENVLVNASGNACLSGFGMSKIKHDEFSTSTDKAFIKRNSEAIRPWMSPERFMGKLTKPTDVWAYAMTVHQVLTGRPPFDGKDPQDIRRAVMASNNTPIMTYLSVPSEDEVAHGYSRGMRKLVETILVYDRASRPKFNAIIDMLAFIRT